MNASNLRNIRNVFALIFGISIVFPIVTPQIQDRTESNDPPVQIPQSQNEDVGGETIEVITVTGSAESDSLPKPLTITIAMISLIGLISTQALAWKKDKREGEAHALDIKLKEKELKEKDT